MNNNINKNIGMRIKERRNNLNMSQTELAEKLNLKNRSTITRYEQGDKSFKQSQIIALAEALNTTPSYLMGWTDDASVKNNSDGRQKQFTEKNNLNVEMAKELIITDMHFIEIVKRWRKEVGEVYFTDEEVKELIGFAKYLISRRKGE